MKNNEIDFILFVLSVSIEFQLYIITAITALQDSVRKCIGISSSSRHMCDVLQYCLALLTQQEQLRSQQLAEEKERCRILQESLRVLAVENHELEQQFGGSVASSTVAADGALSSSYKSLLDMSSFSDDDGVSEDEEFFDCDFTADYRLGKLSADMATVSCVTPDPYHR